MHSVDDKLFFHLLEQDFDVSKTKIVILYWEIIKEKELFAELIENYEHTIQLTLEPSPQLEMLVELAVKGNQIALENMLPYFMKRLSDFAMYANIATYHLHNEDLQDIVQESLITFCEKIHRVLRPEVSVVWSYLRTIFIRKARDFKMHRKLDVIDIDISTMENSDEDTRVVMSDYNEANNDFIRETEHVESRKIIIDIMNTSLNENERAVVDLLLKDKKLKEISGILQIPLSTVYARKQMALRKLQQTILDYRQRGLL